MYLASHFKSPGFSFQLLPVIIRLPARPSHPSLPGISSPWRLFIYCRAKWLRTVCIRELLLAETSDRSLVLLTKKQCSCCWRSPSRCKTLILLLLWRWQAPTWGKSMGTAVRRAVAHAFMLEKQHLLEGARSFYLGSGPQAFFKIFLSHGNSCQVKIASSGWHVSHGKRHKGFVSLDIRDTKKRKELCFVLTTVIGQQRAGSLCGRGGRRGSKYRKRKLDLLTLIPNNQFSAEGRTTNLKFPCLRVTTWVPCLLHVKPQPRKHTCVNSAARNLLSRFYHNTFFVSHHQQHRSHS